MPLLDQQRKSRFLSKAGTGQARPISLDGQSFPVSYHYFDGAAPLPLFYERGERRTSSKTPPRVPQSPFNAPPPFLDQRRVSDEQTTKIPEEEDSLLPYLERETPKRDVATPPKTMIVAPKPERYALQSSETILDWDAAPGVVEEDDWLHAPNKKDTNGHIFTGRGLANIGFLTLLALMLLMLFVGYPVYLAVLSNKETGTTSSALDGYFNSTGQFVVTAQNVGVQPSLIPESSASIPASTPSTTFETIELTTLVPSTTESTIRQTSTSSATRRTSTTSRITTSRRTSTSTRSNTSRRTSTTAEAADR